MSSVVFESIIAAGLPVVGVVTPAPIVRDAPPIDAVPCPPALRRSLPIAGPGRAATMVEQAWHSGCPVYRVRALRQAATLATIAALRPTLCVVACFPRRLPDVLLDLATLGGINVHPSLLPTGRGPSPRFWAFRHNLARGGVTVHQMTSRLDAGPIVAQASLDLPSDLTGRAFDERTACLGGELAVAAVVRLHAGAVEPYAQDERAATYQPAPSLADYALSLDRPAAWVYRFIRGVAGDDVPLHVDLGPQRITVAGAAAVEPDGRLDAPWVWRDGLLWLQCRPGILAVVPATLVSSWASELGDDGPRATAPAMVAQR